MLKHTLPLLALTAVAAGASAQNYTVYPNNPGGDNIVGVGTSGNGAGPVPIVNHNSGDYIEYNAIRQGGNIGIDSAFAKPGETGSMHMQTDGSGTAKADVGIYKIPTGSNAFGSFGRLADVTSFGYSWYRSSTSTGNPTQVPSLRMLISVDGTLSAGSFGQLIYEPIYTAQQTNPTWTAPTDQWVTESITPSQGVFWFNPGSQFPTQTLSQILSGQTAWTNGSGAIDFSNAEVIGISSGVGSGWSTDFDGAVQDINIGFGTAGSRNYSFQAVPEPATMAALGLGAAALLRRRRKSSK